MFVNRSCRSPVGMLGVVVRVGTLPLEADRMKW